MKVILVCLINACKIFATQCDCDSQARLSLPNNLLASNVSQSLWTENWQYYCIQMCTTEMKTSYSSAQQAIISISCSLTLNVVFTARAWWRCAAWELSLCYAVCSCSFHQFYNVNTFITSEFYIPCILKLSRCFWRLWQGKFESSVCSQRLLLRITLWGAFKLFLTSPFSHKYLESVHLSLKL